VTKDLADSSKDGFQFFFTPLTSHFLMIVFVGVRYGINKILITSAVLLSKNYMYFYI